MCGEPNELEIRDAFGSALDAQVAAREKGFDWPDVHGPIAKLREEIDELEAALKEGRDDLAKREIGDLLFTVLNIARFTGGDPVACLTHSIRKFQRRFGELERSLARQGKKIEECSLEEMDAVWEEVKTHDLDA